ncbi:MAG: hypothetical protein H7288_11455 [Kineosporiaceae bacterium]|nr:hypothetical protein [Aeromicrobium sp.]
MHNPFSGYRVTGTWLDHVGVPTYPAAGSTGYSLGGIDYPLPFGTVLTAPAAGTVHISGGSGEFAAGQVGSAGRRTILYLDTPIRDLVAIVFQHQSKFGDPKHVNESDDLGWSGSSANGSNTGGEVHLHIHGLTASGERVDFRDYIDTSSTASFTTQTLQEEDDMFTDADRATQTAIYDWLKGDNGEGGTNLDVIKKATTATESSIEALQVPDTRNRLGNIQYALGVLLARDGNSQAFLSKLSAEDLAAISKAVNDEEDARNRARLGQ